MGLNGQASPFSTDEKLSFRAVEWFGSEDPEIRGIKTAWAHLMVIATIEHFAYLVKTGISSWGNSFAQGCTVNMWQIQVVNSGMYNAVQILFPLNHTDYHFQVNIFLSKYNVYFTSKSSCLGKIAVPGIESLKISRDHFNHHSSQVLKSNNE